MIRTLSTSLLVLALGTGAALAQDATPPETAPMGGMQHMDKTDRMNGMQRMDEMDRMNGMHHTGKMMGMHKMPATVTAADASTGIVDVSADGMAMKVHFPPTAMEDLKPGDKITLYLGFSKP